MSSFRNPGKLTWEVSGTAAQMDELEINERESKLVKFPNLLKSEGHARNNLKWIRMGELGQETKFFKSKEYLKRF